MSTKKKWRRDSRNSVFYVYTHTNSKGDIYIGCGNKYRPHELKKNRRSLVWWESFSDDCTVKIIRECKTREEARFLESNMIRAIGLNNLVNQYK